MNLNPILVNFVKTRSALINYQTVRCRRVRKPFWVGVAKSKMFKIPQQFKKYTEDEFKEFIRLKRDYIAHYKSLMKFMTQDDPRMANIVTVDEKILADLETQINESLQKNDLWNAECAKIREERMKEITEGRLDKVKKIIESKEMKEKELMERIEEIVKIEKALSKTYITPENIDEVIDECLKNVVQYDFAIDLKGNKYYGRETLDKRAKKNEEIEADAAG